MVLIVHGWFLAAPEEGVSARANEGVELNFALERQNLRRGDLLKSGWLELRRLQRKYRLSKRRNRLELWLGWLVVLLALQVLHLGLQVCVLLD